MKKTFALKIVDLNFIFSWKRKYYQSNIALNAFCKIDLIFIQTPFIKWVGWATESLGLSYWVTQTEVLSHSGWAAESLGLGYWVTLRLGYWVTRTELLSHSDLGYWVTHTELRSHSTGLLSHSGISTQLKSIIDFFYLEYTETTSWPLLGRQFGELDRNQEKINSILGGCVYFVSEKHKFQQKTHFF